MEISFYAGFLTLTALALTSGILTIASLTYINTIGSIVFKKDISLTGQEEGFSCKSEEIQDIRHRIIIYPQQIFIMFLCGLALNILLISFYISTSQDVNGKLIMQANSILSLENIIFLASYSKQALSACIVFYISYALYIVWFLTNIAHRYYNSISS